MLESHAKLINSLNKTVAESPDWRLEINTSQRGEVWLWAYSISDDTPSIEILFVEVGVGLYLSNGASQTMTLIDNFKANETINQINDLLVGLVAGNVIERHWLASDSCKHLAMETVVVGRSLTHAFRSGHDLIRTQAPTISVDYSPLAAQAA